MILLLLIGGMALPLAGSRLGQLLARCIRDSLSLIVKAAMFSARHRYQILRAVIVAHLIDVMHMLVASQQLTMRLLPYQPMLHHVPILRYVRMIGRQNQYVAILHDSIRFGTRVWMRFATAIVSTDVRYRVPRIPAARTLRSLCDLCLLTAATQAQAMSRVVSGRLRSLRCLPREISSSGFWRVELMTGNEPMLRALSVLSLKHLAATALALPHRMTPFTGCIIAERQQVKCHALR